MCNGVASRFRTAPSLGHRLGGCLVRRRSDAALRRRRPRAADAEFKRLGCVSESVCGIVCGFMLPSKWTRFSVGLLSLEVGFLKRRKTLPDSQHIASYMAETSGGDGPFPRPGALPQERLQARPRPRTDSRPLECLGLVSWCQGETKRTLTLGGPNFWESMLIVWCLCI